MAKAYDCLSSVQLIPEIPRAKCSQGCRAYAWPAASSRNFLKSSFPLPNCGNASTRKNWSGCGFHKFGKSDCASLSRHVLSRASGSFCKTMRRSPFFSSGKLGHDKRDRSANDGNERAEFENAIAPRQLFSGNSSGSDPYLDGPKIALCTAIRKTQPIVR